MHIIVDIRTASAHELIIPLTGIAWANMWKKHRKDDTISLLVHEHQFHVSDFPMIIVPVPSILSSKKNLRPKKTNQVFRIVQFSAYPVYDTAIPSLMHISSHAEHLYGDTGEGTLARRYRDWQRKQNLKKATTLIVPDIQVGRELVELYNLGEDSIEIIPYIPMPEYTSTQPLQNIALPHPYYIYDGGYGNEANILTFLAAWERYRRNGGVYELLLLGSAGVNLSSLTHTTRSLDLSGSVRYLGALDEGTLHNLYSKAGGWIYVGPYYSVGTTIEVARTYGLPMLLSDITAFASYQGVKVHPNHTADIATSLSRLETMPHKNPQPHHESAYIQAYEKILIKRK